MRGVTHERNRNDHRRRATVCNSMVLPPNFVGVAQMVERLLWEQEVAGSNPATRTISRRHLSPVTPGTGLQEVTCPIRAGLNDGRFGICSVEMDHPGDTFTLCPYGRSRPSNRDQSAGLLVIRRWMITGGTISMEAAVAQLVERAFCKRQVGGSSPSCGSKQQTKDTHGQMRHEEKGR